MRGENAVDREPWKRSGKADQGGAFLEFIEGRKPPTIEALEMRTV
jgi:hypothetical protein